MSDTPKEKLESSHDAYDALSPSSASQGMFNISSLAKKRIEVKRKRKHLGELKPREKNVWHQLF
jgi:hypothetical protein